MKILVTGANGFVGKSISNILSNEDQIEVVAFGRDRLNLLDADNVHDVLTEELPEIVVHCAIKGGTRFDSDTQDTFNQNALMYNNLRSLRSKFGCLINIGSGAEFDRSRSIRRANESLLFERLPSDFYGRVKNEIARDVVQTQNFYNLRIFGCFGALENENRLLKTVFDKNLRSELIEINDDKEMDFIHVVDLAKSILFLSQNYTSKILPKDINVVYSEKALLSDIVNYFIPEEERSSELRINSKSGIDYSGSSSTIDDIESLKFSLLSLKTSLTAYYNELKIQRGSN